MTAEQDKKIGLCVSGGGFRAALFHLGALWRLNDMGWLPKIDRLTSVSGGSITSGVLAMNWHKLQFTNGKATNFVEQVVDPIQRFCSLDMDAGAIIKAAINPFKNACDYMVDFYDENLFYGTRLGNLPSEAEGPQFMYYAASLQTGDSVRFCKAYIADYRIGMWRDPEEVLLAQAVTASSAFPPVMTPYNFKTDPNKWEKIEGADLWENEELREEMMLTDGGVYDNLGLEAVWDSHDVVLCSDAGAPFDVIDESFLMEVSELKQTIRCMSIMMNQVESLRKRKLIDDFQRDERDGTYWGIGTKIDGYGLDNPMVRDNDTTAKLQGMRTRLNKFSDQEQGELINWGYALADAGIRKYVAPDTPMGQWPVPEYALG